MADGEVDCGAVFSDGEAEANSFCFLEKSGAPDLLLLGELL